MITKDKNKKISIFWMPLPPLGGHPRNPFPPKYKYFGVPQFFGCPPPKGGAPYFQTTLCSVSIKTSNKSPYYICPKKQGFTYFTETSA